MSKVLAEVDELSFMRNNPNNLGGQYLLNLIVLFAYFYESHVVHSMFPFLTQTLISQGIHSQFPFIYNIK